MLLKNIFSQRCIDLGRLGAGKVSPNPMVGAIIVYRDKVIGEGFHEFYGKHHAEVNALSNVQQQNRDNIAKSTLYVSLEPCCIQGKTPPCTKLIIENKIPKVVVSNVDKTPEVTGKGLVILQKEGISVTSNVLEAKGKSLSKFRNTFISENRPYIILKYAKSKDGFMGKHDEQVWLTNSFSKRLVHKWRSEVDAILIGTNTAEIDNPQLTTRFKFGRSPKRVVLDRHNRLSSNLNVFNSKAETILISEKETKLENSSLKNITLNKWNISNILSELAHLNITSLIVEGGAKIIDSFIQQNLWDEARIFSAPHLIQKGIKAPTLDLAPTKTLKIEKDLLEVFHNNSFGS